MPNRRSRQRTPHYDRRRRVVKLGAAAADPWYDPNGEGLSVWAAYQAVGAADFAASLVDLSGNGNNAGAPGAPNNPGWDAVNGWVFDGINDYLSTTFVPANDQSQSVLIQYTGAPALNDVIFGCDNGAGRRFNLFANSGTPNVRYRNGGSVSVAPGLAAGNLAIAGNQGYRNGAAEGAAIGAWGLATALAAYIGANNTGVAATHQTCNIQSLVIYDVAITAPQTLAIATAMAAL